jgi:8-oxo-dGTP pyrophosphatase MutT (NUDIX family)
MPARLFVAAKGWVSRDGQTLVLRDTNGTWDLPGGRINDTEFGRIPFALVLERELREEIGLAHAIKPNLVGISQWSPHRRPEKDLSESDIRIFVVHYTIDVPVGFQPVLSPEHQSYRWTSTPEQLLPPGLIPERLTLP